MDSDGNTNIAARVDRGDGLPWSFFSSGLSDKIRTINYTGSRAYLGDSDGNIYRKNTQIAKLSGPVSCLSGGNSELFATTPVTNAFYNVTLGQYNVVKDENGDPKPMIPPTKDGLIRMIDNRRENGKFIFVTTKGVHSIDY